MDRIRIVGGSKLNGTIPISGAKNAALPLMIAGLLSEDTLVLDNVPRLADVDKREGPITIHGVVRSYVRILGVGHEWQGPPRHISGDNSRDTTAPRELVGGLGAGFRVMALRVARMGEDTVAQPPGSET